MIVWFLPNRGYTNHELLITDPWFVKLWPQQLLVCRWFTNHWPVLDSIIPWYYQCHINNSSTTIGRSFKLIMSYCKPYWLTIQVLWDVYQHHWILNVRKAFNQPNHMQCWIGDGPTGQWKSPTNCFTHHWSSMIVNHYLWSLVLSNSDVTTNKCQ